MSGPEMFFRYARPPNRLGYCGPDRDADISLAASGDTLPVEEATELALAFHGAWPYLELIGRLTGRDPLSNAVVEAYWLGSELLDAIDLQPWGHSLADRFGPRAGARWSAISQALNAGGSPNHAFHVFCVYPWVGLLRQGPADPAIEVLDRCRISAGRVVEAEGDIAVVRRRALVWANDSLQPGEQTDEPFLTNDPVRVGDLVALHWDYICQPITARQHRLLIASHDRHLRIANEELRLGRVEPAR